MCVCVCVCACYLVPEPSPSKKSKKKSKSSSEKQRSSASPEVVLNLRKQVQQRDESVAELQCKLRVLQEEMKHISERNNQLEALQTRISTGTYDIVSISNIIAVFAIPVFIHTHHLTEGSPQRERDIESIVSAITNAHAKQTQQLNEEIRRLRETSNENSSQNNNISTMGVEMNVDLKSEIRALQTQNKALQDEIVRLQYDLARARSAPVLRSPSPSPSLSPSPPAS